MKHCWTDDEFIFAAEEFLEYHPETMLKNKVHLVRFSQWLIVSLSTVTCTFNYPEIFSCKNFNHIQILLRLGFSCFWCAVSVLCVVKGVSSSSANRHYHAVSNPKLPTDVICCHLLLLFLLFGSRWRVEPDCAALTEVQDHGGSKAEVFTCCCAQRWCEQGQKALHHIQFVSCAAWPPCVSMRM